MLLSTYKSLSHKEQLNFPPEQELTFDHSPSKLEAVNRVELTSPKSPVSDEASVIAKKPAFLMTWEEREREKKLEKERTKAQRIEEEKQRLEQRTQERKTREEHDQRLSSLLERHRECAATTIQRFLRLRIASYKHQQISRAWAAATCIQSRLRGFLCRYKLYPELVEQRRSARELSLMAQNESEMRAVLEKELELCTKAHNEELEQLGSPVNSPPSSPLHKHDVGVLVSVYRKLKRIFTLAAGHQLVGEGGHEYQSLFAKFDLRRDGVLDRAEFRLGIRNFGIRIDRRLTRAYGLVFLIDESLILS